MSTSPTPQIDTIADTLRELPDGTFIAYGWATLRKVNGLWKRGPVEPITSWDVAFEFTRMPDTITAHA